MLTNRLPFKSLASHHFKCGSQNQNHDLEEPGRIQIFYSSRILIFESNGLSKPLRASLPYMGNLKKKSDFLSSNLDKDFTAHHRKACKGDWAATSNKQIMLNTRKRRGLEDNQSNVSLARGFGGTLQGSILKSVYILLLFFEFTHSGEDTHRRQT